MHNLLHQQTIQDQPNIMKTTPKSHRFSRRGRKNLTTKDKHDMIMILEQNTQLVRDNDWSSISVIFNRIAASDKRSERTGASLRSAFSKLRKKKVGTGDAQLDKLVTLAQQLHQRLYTRTHISSQNHLQQNPDESDDPTLGIENNNNEEEEDDDDQDIDQHDYSVDPGSSLSHQQQQQQQDDRELAENVANRRPEPVNVGLKDHPNITYTRTDSSTLLNNSDSDNLRRDIILPPPANSSSSSSAIASSQQQLQASIPYVPNQLDSLSTSANPPSMYDNHVESFDSSKSNPLQVAPSRQIDRRVNSTLPDYEDRPPADSNQNSNPKAINYLGFNNNPSQSANNLPFQPGYNQKYRAGRKESTNDFSASLSNLNTGMNFSTNLSINSVVKPNNGQVPTPTSTTNDDVMVAMMNQQQLAGYQQQQSLLSRYSSSNNQNSPVVLGLSSGPAGDLAKPTVSESSTQNSLSTRQSANPDQQINSLQLSNNDYNTPNQKSSKALIGNPTPLSANSTGDDRKLVSTQGVKPSEETQLLTRQVITLRNAVSDISTRYEGELKEKNQIIMDQDREIQFLNKMLSSRGAWPQKGAGFDHELDKKDTSKDDTKKNGGSSSKSNTNSVNSSAQGSRAFNYTFTNAMVQQQQYEAEIANLQQRLTEYQKIVTGLEEDIGHLHKKVNYREQELESVKALHEAQEKLHEAEILRLKLVAEMGKHGVQTHSNIVFRQQQQQRKNSNTKLGMANAQQQLPEKESPSNREDNADSKSSQQNMISHQFSQMPSQYGNTSHENSSANMNQKMMGSYSMVSPLPVHRQQQGSHRFYNNLQNVKNSNGSVMDSNSQLNRSMEGMSGLGGMGSMGLGNMGNLGMSAEAASLNEQRMTGLGGGINTHFRIGQQTEGGNGDSLTANQQNANNNTNAANTNSNANN